MFLITNYSSFCDYYSEVGKDPFNFHLISCKCLQVFFGENVMKGIRGNELQMILKENND